MNQEIKVTKCVDCPMCVEIRNDGDFNCTKGAFAYVYYLHLEKIHPDCPLNGQTITYKFGENE